MSFVDLREFLKTLEHEGQLARVPVKVDLDYELGAVVRRAADLDGPAPYFETVKGHSIPVAANLLGTRERIALGLECAPDAFVDEWLVRTRKPVPPVSVAEGVCQEVVFWGDRADLGTLPAPLFNDLDGGRFITAGVHISQDPETGERNAGIYRNQIHGPRRLGIEIGPYRHLTLHQAAAERTGRRFPVAIAVGVDPAVYLAAAADFALGVDELAMAGALRGTPVELVQCLTIPLSVPAFAEFVIEGELLPGERQPEGPFGEFTGYYGSVAARPVIEVTAITHRRDPVYQAGYTGKPPCEDIAIAAVVKEANILRDVTLPGLRAIHLTAGGSGHFTAVASIETSFAGYGKMMAMAILGTWPGRTIKHLTIVDADVDPFDPREVEWAVATRVQADRDVEILRGLTGVVLDPSLSVEDRETGRALTAKLIVDATRFDAASYERVVVPRAEDFGRVTAEWERYGIGKSDDGGS